MRGQAGALSLDAVNANALELCGDSEDFSFKKGGNNNLFKSILDVWASEDLGSSGRDVWSHFVYFFQLFSAPSTSVV